MGLPKFTAEASLGRSRRTYRGKYPDGGPSQSGLLPTTIVLPSQLMGMEEVPLGDEGEAELEEDMGVLLGDEGGAELADTEAYVGDEDEAEPMDETGAQEHVNGGQCEWCEG
jgi:hypothetical protein